ncbi:AAA family ATPase [Methylobacterium sp. SyP6R]|uniref:AAA family ATPase n=1 Tax=Methylobacterium sp. SyP6R TaxID=2718876 RepID=UPI001F484E85|nr:AAA family ATPase [Methylobacterium sp. SyP6R]MCF4128460.1 AAA family ATPase [Methylobacterium sp. SyP6R]
MAPALPVRWVVIGNSGSGKSTLAERLGTALSVPVHDLDLVHWHPDGGKRDEDEARARVAGIAATEAWIVEGVYGWLSQVALARATTLVWLDLPWEACRDGLLARGLRRGMTLDDQRDLLAWAQDYWARTTSSSFTGHRRIHDAFAGTKVHLCTRDEVAAFMA